MSKRDFENCDLYLTSRSPYARRVRVGLQLLDIPFRLRFVDILNPDDEFLLLNPAGRVPAVALRNGGVLVESSEILNALEPSKATTVLERFWVGLALALMDQTVLTVLNPNDETMKWELDRTIQQTLPRFEPFLSPVSRASTDLAIALDYISFRHSDGWKDQFPRVSSWRRSLSQTLPFLDESAPSEN